MEPADLTVRILQEIRDGVGGLSGKFDDLNARFDKQTALFEGRFEVIETVLRDLTQQLVVLAH